MPRPPVDDRCADRSVMMPRRRRTRAQSRTQRIEAERRHNRDDRIARREARNAFYSELTTGITGTEGDGDPPPF
jgi:hypothetical protein